MGMKAHLFRTSTPLVPDNPVTALCLVIVPHARAVYFQDCEFLDAPTYGKGICKKCMDKLKPDLSRHLLYAVCNNQELILERSLRA